MKLTEETKYRKTVAWLRRNFPPKGKVTVRRVRKLADTDNALGYTMKSGRGWYIAIHNGSSIANQRHILLHEWAHTLEWNDRREDHSPQWATTYGEIYRLWETWDYGRAKQANE